MTQLSLEEAMAARVRARRTDPSTSFQAAGELVSSGELGRQQGEALVLVRSWPGMTTWELAGGEPILRFMLNRRLPELVRKGLVRKGEARRCRYSRRPSLTWWPI